MKKILINKIMTAALITIFCISLIPISSACTPKLTFEDIVISTGIEEGTNKPLDTKTEFDASAEHIYATIKIFGVKGGDNYRFKWTNLDTGETVLDKGDQYNKDKKENYFEGILGCEIYPLDESAIIPPGDYEVEFYNKGELIKTATFKVNKPQVKILEVSLANQVDQNYEPVTTTQEFKSNETVYACVKVDYQIIGNTLKAQWKSSTGELLNETKFDLPVDIYSPLYIAFLFPPETEVIPAGSYKVEIYLNDSLYGSFDFEVTSEVAEAAVTFDQDNKYSSTDFGFTITIPDNWTYEESKTAEEVDLNISPPSQNLPVGLNFSAANSLGDYSSYEEFADDASAIAAEQQSWTFVEKSKNDAVLENGTPCKEYYYRYSDNDNNNWVMGYSFAENKGKIYWLFVIAEESNIDIATAVYMGMLKSLTFN
ncbi:MAG: hypothetical protein IMZ59_01845 [Actinobacteria bacterium]|nr:hypothetical protein [Actinomycetota bacterium]